MGILLPGLHNSALPRLSLMMFEKEVDVNGYSNDPQIDETDETKISDRVPNLAVGYGIGAWNTDTMRLHGLTSFVLPG
jgi:hypothetical protein